MMTAYSARYHAAATPCATAAAYTMNSEQAMDTSGMTNRLNALMPFSRRMNRIKIGMYMA